MLAEGPIAPGVPVDRANDQFDLNGDDAIDNDDHDLWLADAANNGLGLALSGRRCQPRSGSVDVSDFNAWNGDKFTSSLQWDQGDFNGDGVVDVADFNAWNNNKFTSSATAAVPEPASVLLLFVATLFLIKGRRSVLGRFSTRLGRATLAARTSRQVSSLPESCR